MRRILVLFVLVAICSLTYGQDVVNSKGYLYREYSKGVHCEDGVLFITFDDYYSMGNTKRGETLVKFPQNKNVTSYTIPDGVVTIAKGAFQGNKYIKTIRIPYSVKYIGDNAFADCEQLQSIEMYGSTNSVRANEADDASSEVKEVGRYNIQGVKIQEDENGEIQIILYSDGTSKKILK